MEERKFKTSAKCAGCVNKIAEKMDTATERASWDIDLSTPDRIMTVRDNALTDDAIQELVRSAGFKIEKI